MGVAQILVNGNVRRRIIADAAIADLVKILEESDYGDGLFIMRVKSPLLPKDAHGVYDIIIEGDKVRFKPDMDV